MHTFLADPSPCRLPVETLDDIISRLDHLGLAGVAHTSQVLNAVATPHLYRAVTLSTLATLLARPDLRSYGKKAVIHYDDLPDEFDEDNQVTFTPPSEHVWSFDETINKVREDGAMSAPPRLLLHLLPSLETLDLAEWWPTKCREFFHAAVPLFEEPNRAPMASGLRSLRFLECSYGDTEGGFDTDTVVRMLTLPSLTSLILGAVNGNEAQPDGLEERLPSLYGTSSLTTLVFDWSAIHPRILGHFVRIPSALQSFTYNHGGSIVGYAEIGVGELASALYPIHEHLRELVVEDYSGELEDGAFGSFRDFKHLVKLKTKVEPRLLTNE
jgi:hypothetical protein